jgi:hypothetical protein
LCPRILQKTPASGLTTTTNGAKACSRSAGPDSPEHSRAFQAHNQVARSSHSSRKDWGSTAPADILQWQDHFEPWQTQSRPLTGLRPVRSMLFASFLSPLVRRLPATSGNMLGSGSVPVSGGFSKARTIPAAPNDGLARATAGPIAERCLSAVVIEELGTLEGVEHNRLRLSRCNFRIAVGLSRASIKKQKGPDAGRGLSWSRLAHAGACWTPGGKCVSKSARE